MDKMLPYELADILDNLLYCDKNSWEQSRIIAYYIAQKMCKKQLNIREIIPLVWDKNNVEHTIDMDIIKKEASVLEDILNLK